MQTAGDPAIWEHAVISSKDEDFVDRWLQSEVPVALIWIRKGHSGQQRWSDWNKANDSSSCAVRPSAFSRRINSPVFMPLATVAAVDVLVSWNFRHIVRLDRIQLFNEVNTALGRGALTIYSRNRRSSAGLSPSSGS